MTTSLRSLAILCIVFAHMMLGQSCFRAAITPGEGGIVLLLPEQDDPTIAPHIEHFKRYLEELSGYPPRVLKRPKGTKAALVDVGKQLYAGVVFVMDVDLLAPELLEGRPKLSDYKDRDAFYLITQNEGDWPNNMVSIGCTFVYAAGATKLARQYAMYEFLRRLGARFYHPQKEYLPRNTPGVVRDRASTPTIVAQPQGDDPDLYLPDFSKRAYSFPTQHPLPFQEAFSDDNHPIDEARRLNEWIVKNRGNRFRYAGAPITTGPARDKRIAALGRLRQELGFPQTIEVSLHDDRSGRPLAVDPTQQTPAKQQIKAFITQALKEHPDAIELVIHYGPANGPTPQGQETLDWINWAGQEALRLKPKLRITVVGGVTGAQPVASFDDLGCTNGTNKNNSIDYADLSFHTDERFGLQVRTPMFFPLEGDAFVLGHKSLEHKLCLMQKASREGRALSFSPASSHWRGFDNDVPVYLPLYLHTRRRDIQKLRALLERQKGTLFGHQMVSSGHAWGYWQQDYAAGLWHWKSDITIQEVIGELLDPLCEPKDWRKGCEAKTNTRKVMMELLTHQQEVLLRQADWSGRVGGVYAYLAGDNDGGSWPARVAFRTVLAWGQKELKAFVDSDLQALKDMDRLHQNWLSRLQEAMKTIPNTGKPWLQEIIDGVETNMLRARQAASLYGTVIAYREAQLRNEEKRKTSPNAKLEDPVKAAAEPWQLAAQTLDQARGVIRRRERGYRYPIEQMIGGSDEPDKKQPNGTSYPYRLYFKVHTLAHWHLRHRQVQALLEDDGP